MLKGPTVTYNEATGFYDQSPVHRWIAEHCLEKGDKEPWIYNGAAVWVKRKDQTLVFYVCRARDMNKNGQSHVVLQVYLSHENVWTPIAFPKVLQIPTERIAGMDSGPQDPRIFQWKRDVWVVFNMIHSSSYRRMHLYNATSGGKTIALSIVGSSNTRVEKNWTPFIFNEKLFFIYTFYPLVLLVLSNEETGECTVAFADREAPRPMIRGGTPAIEVTKNKFVGFLHVTRPLNQSQIKFDSDRLPIPAKATSTFYRTHRFELFFDGTSPPRLTLHSEFAFFDRQIELVYGWDGGDCVVLNVDDCKTVLITNVNDFEKKVAKTI